MPNEALPKLKGRNHVGNYTYVKKACLHHGRSALSTTSYPPHLISLSELNRNPPPWQIWMKSQRYRESSCFLHSIAHLNRGWGCSRRDEAEESVQSANKDLSTRTTGNVGRYVVVRVGHLNGC